jgi:hypothetical protein
MEKGFEAWRVYRRGDAECKGEETLSGECQCQMDPPRACAV